MIVRQIIGIVFIFLVVLGAESAEEYYVAVATTKGCLSFPGGTSTKFAFGYSSQSAHDAGVEAVKACEKYSGDTCWSCLSSLKGGCMMLVLGGWLHRGEATEYRFFAQSSTVLSPEELARDTISDCESAAYSGIYKEDVLNYKCTPKYYFCSSHVDN